MNNKPPFLKSRLFFLAGMFAPFLFIFTAILGGLLRPGYGHLSDTISELFSPGSPNKLLLDIFHTIYTLLLILFGVGLLRYTKRHPQTKHGGVIGSWLYILMGFLSLTIATIFPQDPWGTPPTFPGQMHMYVSGILSIITLISMALIGSWLRSSGEWPTFHLFTWVIIILSIGTAIIFYISVDSPVMGLAERFTTLPAFCWTISLALNLYKKDLSHVTNYGQ